VLLQRFADFGAGPVEQHSLISLAEVQGVTDVFGGPTFDVTEGDDLALGGRKSGDRAIDGGTSFGGEEAFLGERIPVGREGRPVTGPLVTGREEAVGSDVGLFVVTGGSDSGERNGAVIALAAALGAVGQNTEEPGLERGTPLEAIDPLEDTEPPRIDW
jgi:hypothetical protein